MPLRLKPPRPGKSPNYTIRGSYLGVRVDRTAGTARKAVAAAELAKLERAIERGDYPPRPPEPAAPTFLSAALAYLRAGRRRRYVHALIEHFGETPLSQIDQAAIDAAAAKMLPDAKPITRNTAVHTPVSAILHHAGVTITVKRPKGYKGERVTRFLLPTDAFAIIAAADAIDSEMARLLTFLLYTGCRIGEALALHWRNVDLDRGVAYIETSKNGDARSVRLSADAHAALLAMPGRDGKVFRFRQGGHRNFIFLNAKVTACGLPQVARPKPSERMQVPPYRYDWVTFHTFCHTWATWMRRYGGADLQGLVATGRWRDPRSAERYTHTAAHDEWQRVDQLPSRGKSVESPAELRKAK